MAKHAVAPTDLVRQLGVSTQAASQLIDTLVLRGSLSRDADPDDRRRLEITLTERGRAAAVAVRSGVTSVDAEPDATITPEQRAALRTGLVALTTIRERRVAR